MSDVQYEHIAPLIASTEQQGSSIQVVFRCPVTARDVRASGRLQVEDTLGNKVAESAKRRVGWSLRSALGRAVRQAVGYGIAGGIASDVTTSAVSSVTEGGERKYSDADRQRAVVDAFEGVRSEFAWDGQRFISAEAAGAVQPALVKQLAAAPVVAPYDRGVLARMLAEVAAMDGQLGADEEAFFSHFITPDMGTLEQIAARPPLSPVELAETTAGPVRDTMLMMAWSLALTDRQVEAAEHERLNRFAQGLAIPPDRAAELMHHAQIYVVDQSLGPVYANGQRDAAAYQQVVALGQQIGLSQDDVEQTDIRFRKRHGIV